MKGLFLKSKGFTLVELMVVMTILAILAGIVVPSVTGVATTGRGSVKTADINTVQQAIDRFAADAKGLTQGYPTYNGNKPVLVSPATTATAAIDWNAYFVAKDGTTSKYFSIGTAANKNTSDYISGNIPHATATKATPTVGEAVAVEGDLQIKGTVWNVISGTVASGAFNTGTDETKAVWRINEIGKVVLLLTDSQY